MLSLNNVNGSYSPQGMFPFKSLRWRSNLLKKDLKPSRSWRVAQEETVARCGEAFLELTVFKTRCSSFLIKTLHPVCCTYNIKALHLISLVLFLPMFPARAWTVAVQNWQSNQVFALLFFTSSIVKVQNTEQAAKYERATILWVLNSLDYNP